MSELEATARELEQAAARLRSDEIDSEEAAALVERCAELAAALGSALDRQAAAARDEPSAQERLL